MQYKKIHRVEKNISQDKLSCLSGFCRNKISRIECGYCEVTEEESKILLKAIKEYVDVKNKKIKSS